MRSKRLAWRQHAIVTVQDRMQAVADLRALVDEPLAMTDERSQFAHMHRRHPDCRHQVGSEQMGQFDGITRVSFDTGSRNQLDGQRMRHRDRADQGLQLIVEQPSIGSGFHDHCIRGAQMGACPGREGFETKTTWRQDDLLVGIDRSHHQILAVAMEARQNAVAEMLLPYVPPIRTSAQGRTNTVGG